MKFTKLFWFDLRRGFFQRPQWFLIPVIVALTSCLTLSAGAAGLDDMETFQTAASPGFWDYIMYLYGGMDRFIPAPGNLFTFPVRWMMVFLLAAFLTLQYPFSDLQGLGQQILIRTKGRTAWWLSKCGWNLCSILVYHGLMFLTAALFCAATQADFSGGFHKELLYVVFQVREAGQTAADTVWQCSMVLLPVLVSLSLSLLQMSLALVLKPVFSFFAVASVMISSAYCTSPWLIGNYGMPIRYDAVITDGVSIKSGVICCVAVLLAAVFAGCAGFLRYDILNRD